MIAFLIVSLKGGGAEKVLSLIANELIKNNKILIITLSKDKFAYEIDKNIEVISLSDKGNYEKNKLEKLFEYITLPIKLNYIIKQYKIKKLISLITRANIINLLTSFISKHKPILWEHSIVSKSQQNNQLNKFLIKLLYPKAQKIIAVSNATKEDLIKNFNLDSNKIEVLYNPIEKEKILQLKDECIEEDLIKKLQTTYSISFVGRNDKAKNLPLLLKAITKIDDVILILIGIEKNQKDLNILVEKLGIKNRVIFLGWQSNPYKYISKTNLFVLPSLWESFGNVVIETLYCGVPVLTSDAYALKELNILTKSTIVFENNDLNDLVERIEYCKNNEIKIRNNFNILFDIENISKQLMRIVND